MTESDLERWGVSRTLTKSKDVDGHQRNIETGNRSRCPITIWKATAARSDIPRARSESGRASGDESDIRLGGVAAEPGIFAAGVSTIGRFPTSTSIARRDPRVPTAHTARKPEFESERAPPLKPSRARSISRFGPNSRRRPRPMKSGPSASARSGRARARPSVCS